jgi:hypothetical protein
MADLVAKSAHARSLWLLINVQPVVMNGLHQLQPSDMLPRCSFVRNKQNLLVSSPVLLANKRRFRELCGYRFVSNSCSHCVWLCVLDG